MTEQIENILNRTLHINSGLNQFDEMHLIIDGKQEATKQILNLLAEKEQELKQLKKYIKLARLTSRIPAPI